MDSLEPHVHPHKLPRPHGQPVLILGAGRGGTAMLELFLDDPLVEVIAMADVQAGAPGLLLARQHGIPAFSDVAQALEACRDIPDCIVYNLTHDDAIDAQVQRVLGRSGTGGVEAKLIWQMVTHLKRVKVDLQASQNQFKAIFDGAMDGIVIFDEHGRIHGFNPAAEQIFGYAQHEILGRNIAGLWPKFQAGPESLPAGLAAAGTRAREFAAVRKDGGAFESELSASEMQLAGQRLFVGIVRDITERKRVHERIHQLAHHDFLTQLPNRALFKDRLERSIAMAERNQTHSAVLFVDLDGFKAINDELGHEAGDWLLCEMAERMTQAIRQADTLARMGGDEFTLILDDVSGRDDVARVARKLLKAVSQPFVITGQRRQIGASVGIALYPNDARDYDGLLRCADEAMYAAKQAGKNTYRFGHGAS
jgi:diguanylate cyclase (GGDEF)-like protein/PAS domain S-box-containing protein